MLGCEHCQQQLLPYLYDLLEGEERQQVQWHLESCPSCQAALQAARAQQSLLAEAVKEPQADVAFVPPAPTRARPVTGGTTVVMPRPARRRPFYRNRAAVAAGLLFVLFLGGGGISWGLWRAHAERLDDAEQRHARARQDADKLRQDITDRQGQTQAEIRAIQQEIDGLLNNWKQEEQKTLKVYEHKRARIHVIGPKAVRAGAPANFKIDVNPPPPPLRAVPPGAAKVAPPMPPPPRRLQVRAVDQASKKVLYEQVYDTSRQPAINFTLPRDVPIKPDTQLTLELEADLGEGAPVTVREHLSLAFPQYVTHLTTDRPLYRPGETVRFRSLTLERFALTPAHEELRLRFRILGPNGAELYKIDRLGTLVDADKKPVTWPDGTPVRGVGTGTYALPADLPGGEYTLSVTEANERFPEERRSFLVHRWQTPRYNKDLAFDRGSYGPGEPVNVVYRATPVQAARAPAPAQPQPPLPPGVNEPAVPPFVGGPAAAARSVRLKAIVDGQTIFQQQRGVGANGQGPAAVELTFHFVLPGRIAKDHGVVVVEDFDGGHVETLVRPLPLVVRDLRLEFYPEGGELIAGVSNRVYFQARTPAGKPADLRGRIVDDRGKEVARAETMTDAQEPGLNQGLGVFAFVPEPNRRYELKLDAPLGVPQRFFLPFPARADGVALHLPRGVVTREIPVEVTSIGAERELLVGAYCRGRLLAHATTKASAGKTVALTLRPLSAAGGVYRVTVFERRPGAGNDDWAPVAERLLYRKAQEKVTVAIEPNRTEYHPGEHATLTLKARDEKGAPVAALALVAVTNNSLTKLANNRTTRRMPTHFLLTTEVRRPEDLEDADVLIGPHPKAEQALDLLLGAQGWRRFAEQDPQRFNAVRGPRTRTPIFLAQAEPVTQLVDTERRLVEKIDQTYVDRYVTLEKKLAEQERRADEVPRLHAQLNQSHFLMQQAEQRAAQERAELAEVRAWVFHYFTASVLVAVLFIAMLLVRVGLARLGTNRSGAVLLSLGAGLLLLTFGVSILGTLFVAVRGDDGLFGMRHQRWGRGVAKVAAVPPPPMVVGMGGVPGGAQRNDVVEGAAIDVNALPQPPVDEERAEPPAGMVEAQPARVLKARPQPPADFAAVGPAAGALPNIAIAPAPAAPPRGLVRGPMAPRRPLGPEWERVLRQRGEFQQLLQQHLGRRVELPAANDPSVVRVYAHQHQAQADRVRRDFAETLYWHPALMLLGGAGTVQFDFDDAATGFEVLVLSHTPNGRLGADRVVLTTRLPFTIEPRVPPEVTNTDRITVPVALSNGLKEQGTLHLRAIPRDVAVEGAPTRNVTLPPSASTRELFQLRPTIREGTVSLRLFGRMELAGRDAIERSFRVVPDGFPRSGSAGGTLDRAAVEHEIVLPETWLPGSLELKVQAFPSALADLQQGLDGMLREPSGCFEQSSSSNYPNVLVLDYLRTKQIASPTAEQRSRQLLATGYGRLTSFECVDPGAADVKRGFEWFGGTAPPHEALTAYGLLQFHDMAKVYPVAPELLQRTRKYLLDQRDGKGGFKRNPRAIDQFGRAPAHVTDAYIVWALTETGGSDSLDRELDALRRRAEDSKDAYFLALVALGHLNRGRTEQALPLLRRLRDQQQANGQVSGATTSITGSRGRDLAVETTALTALALLKARQPGEFHNATQKAITWLNGQRAGAGSFGATQATILALKALLAHAPQDRRGQQHTTLTVQLGENVPIPPAVPLGQNLPPGVDAAVPEPAGAIGAPMPPLNMHTVGIPPRTRDTITLTLPTQSLKPGKNKVRVALNGAGPLPYTLSWSYRTHKPANDPAAPIRLRTSLSKEQALEGETVRLTALVENATGAGHGMTVAVIGLPAGLALPEDARQLKDLARRRDDGKRPGVIGSWELRGRDLVLYWRELAPNAKVQVELDLVCRQPGQYRGRAGRAYLYYGAEHKHWSEPLSIRIDPRAR